MRFHLRELIAVWRIAVPGALIQSAFSTSMAALILHALGWDWSSGIVLGLAISVASTVVEDILTVAYMLLLPLMFTADGGWGNEVGGMLALAALKIAGLVVSVAVLVLASGIAVGSSMIFGVSMELGAFLAGLAVSRTEFAARAAGTPYQSRPAHPGAVQPSP
ncbi:MAG: Inner membrane protein YbaL [Syntrophus sp. PtaU1.Bin208]|nr:MAG: Inner membrane protein YbaL [Syntrophus sp. PtaU1.Bin208]